MESEEWSERTLFFTLLPRMGVRILNIDEIYDLLIWDASYSADEYESRKNRGIAEAGKLKNIYPFIQPIVVPEEKSKSVWESCARIISLKSNDELQPFLNLLFAWLQDINWPGAEIVFERLANFPFSELEKTYQFSRLCALRANDELWLATLDDFEKRMIQCV
ncbi:MAG: DUF5071 domain-containing protein [Oscillospiraceae bacterium]|nr:DUF5071 domain-containing protein [Oscillospiraceae bacterium]